MSPQNKLPSTNGTALKTLGLVILIAIIALIGISILVRGFPESPPPPAFVAGAASTQVSPSETPIPPTQASDVTPTPLVIMGVPVDVTPPPTYAVGPTAQFTELLPTSKWLTYEDKQADFSVKYPPDWYLRTTPEQERAAGSTTSLHSYDPEDPNLDILAKSEKWPPNFIKVEIYVNLPESMGVPLKANESIEDWAHRSPAFTSDERLVFEENIQLDGVQAFRQIIESEKNPPSSVIYLPVDEYIMFIVYPFEEGETFNNRVTRTIVDSIRITK